tara:strand:- start:4365 stop:5318 length:954 start_codon:yes stop_codon:yes gene_type:complete
MKMRVFLIILFLIPYVSFSQLSPCQQEVANSIGLIGEFVPQCTEDGSYSSTQCWFSTGYCWCVDEDGIEIPGTSTASWLGMPNCSNESCTLIPDPGPCFAAIEAFYFDTQIQQCLNFSWGGCAGVVPFSTIEECLAAGCINQSISCEANYMQGCTWFSSWDPVCGCNNITYSNSAEAACNNITEFTNGECKTELTLGCTDLIACNYNPMANEEDESCVYAEIYYDCYHNCIEDQDQDFICDPFDNCILLYNPYQIDTDEDGFGDLCDENIGIESLMNSSIELIKMFDALGREVHTHEKGQILFYLYDNGRVKKKILF